MATQTHEWVRRPEDGMIMATSDGGKTWYPYYHDVIPTPHREYEPLPYGGLPEIGQWTEHPALGLTVYLCYFIREYHRKLWDEGFLHISLDSELERDEGGSHTAFNEVRDLLARRGYKVECEPDRFVVTYAASHA